MKQRPYVQRRMLITCFFLLIRAKNQRYINYMVNHFFVSPSISILPHPFLARRFFSLFVLTHLSSVLNERRFPLADHQNWFGLDDQLGPVAISIRREKVIPDADNNSSITQYQYRLVIRTSELQTLRGTVLEDAIPNIKASSNPKTLHTKGKFECLICLIVKQFVQLNLHIK